MNAKVVAVVDDRGYLYCTDCAKACGAGGTKMYSDNAALENETCEVCGSSAVEENHRYRFVRGEGNDSGG